MSSAAASSVPTIVRKSLGWSIGISVLMIVAGILAMIIPPAAGIAVTVFVGWVLVFSGLLHFVYAWQSREARAILWEVLVGILYVFIGGYLLWNPIIGLASLTFALAIYLFFEAVLEFILAYRLRPAPGSGWLAVDGVITLILAVLIWRTWPVEHTLGARVARGDQHVVQRRGSSDAFAGCEACRREVGLSLA